MLTGRAWWFLVVVVLTLTFGVLGRNGALGLIGLALLLWFTGNWLLFAFRVQMLRGRIRVVREVADDRGPAASLWAGTAVEVRVVVEPEVSAFLRPMMTLPHGAVFDRVPFVAELVEGEPVAEG